MNPSLNLQNTTKEVDFHFLRRPFLRFALVVLVVSGFIAFPDDDFPILIGLVVWIIPYLSLRIFFNSRYHYWTSFFAAMVLLFGFPLGTAYMVLNKSDIIFLASYQLTRDAFFFSYEEYVKLFLLSAVGMAGLILGQLAVGRASLPYKTFLRFNPSSSSQKYLLSAILLMVLAFFFWFLAVYSTITQSVGIPGIRVALETPYLFGFMNRLGLTVVPTISLGAIYMLSLYGRKSWINLWLIVLVTLGIGLSIVTSSRWCLLQYLIAPLLYLSVSVSVRQKKLIALKSTTIAICILSILGVVAATLVRFATYESSSSSGASSRFDISEYSDSEVLVRQITGALGFFNRLLGARELSYVSSADGVAGEGWDDIWNGTIIARSGTDSFHRRTSNFDDPFTDDFSFAITYIMFATLYIPFAPNLALSLITVLLGSFTLFMVIWLLERCAYSLLGSCALVLPFTISFFLHVWQSGALFDFAQRQLIMYLIAFAIAVFCLKSYKFASLPSVTGLYPDLSKNFKAVPKSIAPYHNSSS